MGKLPVTPVKSRVITPLIGAKITPFIMIGSGPTLYKFTSSSPNQPGCAPKTAQKFDHSAQGFLRPASMVKLCKTDGNLLRLSVGMFVAWLPVIPKGELENRCCCCDGKNIVWGTQPVIKAAKNQCDHTHTFRKIHN